MKQEIAINGMTCGGCVKNVEKAISQIEGVKTVSVSLNPPQAVIEADSNISKEQLQGVLSKAGHYSVAGTKEAEEPKKPGSSCCG